MSSSKTQKKTALIVLVLIAALALGSLSAFAGGGGGGGGSSSGGEESAAEVEEQEMSAEQKAALLSLQRRDEADTMAVGEKDAPVVMIEYSDFQCPFCGKFARDTKPELKKLVEDGTLRLEWRNFPIFGEESEKAAQAGWAAGEQGRFWAFHDVAYAKERKKNTGEFAEDKLLEMAREAGVPDLEKFEKDMKSKAAKQAIALDSQEGQSLGVSSTPAFLINHTPIMGAQPTEVFVDAVEAAAAEAKKAGKGE